MVAVLEIVQFLEYLKYKSYLIHRLYNTLRQTKKNIFPVSGFVERIKDFDTGETYELGEALKKFREIMGLPKEEK